MDKPEQEYGSVFGSGSKRFQDTSGYEVTT